MLYPENDFRNYLEHSASHKYISKKMGNSGKWIYTYPKDAGSKSNTAKWSKWRVHQDANNKVYAIENAREGGSEEYERVRMGKRNRFKKSKANKSSKLKSYRSVLNRKLSSFERGSDSMKARKNALLTGGGAR